MIGQDWELNHVGLMVTDRNAVLRHFQAAGLGVSVGPQPLLPHEPGEGSLTFYRTLEGDPVTNTYQTGGAHHFTDGNSQIGDCQLECYPMRAGPGMIMSEYLAKYGPGINHICFNTPAVEEDTTVLVSKGCPLTFNALVNGRTVENYLDTRTQGNVMISLRPPASEWEIAWKANNHKHPLVNDWHFCGLGVVVTNLEEAVAYYRTLGFDPCSGITLDQQLGVRRQSVAIGPITFEFNEPTTDQSIYAESMSVRGPGVADLIFEVTDLGSESTRLLERGIKLFGRGADGNSAYFDTRAQGNILVRLTTN